MAEKLVIVVSEDEKRQVETLASDNPFARGNLSAYVRGIIYEKWQEHQKSSGGKRVVMAQGLNGPAIVDPEFGNK